MNFWTKAEHLSGNWKAHFLVFFFLIVVFFVFFVFFVVVSFLGGFVLFGFLFSLFFLFFWEGLRVRWVAQRATSLGPKPSLFFLVSFVLFSFCLCCCFLKKNLFPLKNSYFLFIFQCLPLFLPSFFTSPLFTLCFSFCLLFLSFFLPSLCYSFLPFFASLIFSLCFFGLFLCFKNNIKILNQNVLFISSVCFGVFFLVSSLKSLFLSLLFSLF